MRIAYLSASGALGGAERVLLDLLASLRAARPDWPLSLIAGEDGPLLDRVRALGVAAHVLPLPRALASLGDAGAQDRMRLLAGMAGAAPVSVLYLARLRRWIAREQPQVVHTNGFKMHLLGAWAAPRTIPVVWHLHDFLSGRRAMSSLLRGSARRCALAVAVSDAVSVDARAVLGPAIPLRTVHNGVDLRRFSPDGPALDLDALTGLPPAPEGTVRIGLVAAMGRWKGHEIFLRALACVPRDLPIRAYVVGGAIYRTAGSEVSEAELRRLADELGVTDRVVFTGFVDDPAAAMRALDVVVHASTQPEPFGLVIAEGMACGRAVIASAAGGAAEIVTDGVDSLAVAPGDVQALADSVARLARDAALQRALGAAGRRTVERRFDASRLASALVPLYRSLTPIA